ncbi:hypothetical protein, partial [Novosphingobium sp. Chol11]|uniref:hypothetical protein n=1 Tax=Novosphingobium sp. Chol11 TaxID=1385763 RepID=UPI0025CE7DB0
IAIGRDIRHDAHVDEHKYDAGQMRSIARKKVCGSRSTSWACPAYGSARMPPTTRTPRQQSRQMTTGSALAGGPLPSDSKKPRALDCPDGVHGLSIVLLTTNATTSRLENFMEIKSTRYISLVICDFISDFLCYCCRNKGLSPDEIAIICVIVTQTVRELKTSNFARVNFGTENFALPNEYRPSISVKFVQNQLGMSRETTRQKLESLGTKKFMHKTKGGYTFPAQYGDDDLTKDLREYLMKRYILLQEDLNNMPD